MCRWGPFATIPFCNRRILLASKTERKAGKEVDLVAFPRFAGKLLQILASAYTEV